MTESDFKNTNTFPHIKADTLFSSPFLNLYDYRNDVTGHYYVASRNKEEDLLALKPYEEAVKTGSEAVSCIVIFVDKCKEAYLMLFEEYRYPVGQYVLAIPSGLTEENESPIEAAKRELYEETGIRDQEIISVKEVSVPLFTTPGITDERCTFVCLLVDGLPRQLDHDHASESELFRREKYISEEDAYKMLESVDMGTDFCSVVSWCALMYFQSGLWKKQDP
ncbi:MAG: NUDIX hydrolase [Eubacterium sp.]|nr:NUDIX hydrolase [Eubacterium sp.]